MEIVKRDITVYFDCDETLVFVDSIPLGTTQVWVQIPSFPGKFCGIHNKHVQRLKDHKMWGNGVVVWSRSGYEWATAVVKALQIEDFVDIILSKPQSYYDDKVAEKFMGEHRFLDVDIQDNS